MSYLKTISDWMSFIKSYSAQAIDLSLERVNEVGQRLKIQANCPVITVAGTNGKGSTVAALEAIYCAQGLKTASFTSPYLFQFTEQIKISGRPVEEDLLCRVFQQVYDAAKEISLTQFEMTTLAAFIIFQQSGADVWILEVGLGGRFDAVNLLSADVAVITSIALDHQAWLGNTREQIAYEKCGIFRQQQDGVCGDFFPPERLLECARELNVSLFCQNQQFCYEDQGDTWNWQSGDIQYHELPRPPLLLQNMSTALMAIDRLKGVLPVSRSSIEAGLKQVHLPGRIQVVPEEVAYIFDVSHNPAAIQQLAVYLKKNPIRGQTRAVFSMLADKDINSSILEIKETIDHWYVAPIQHERGASRSMLEDSFQKVAVFNVDLFDSLQQANSVARAGAQPGDRIVVFGSFHTVSSVALLDHPSKSVYSKKEHVPRMEQV